MTSPSPFPERRGDKLQGQNPPQAGSVPEFSCIARGIIQLTFYDKATIFFSNVESHCSIY